MSELNITIPSGKKKRLLTAGKYCEDNIVVTAEESGIATLYGTYLLKETISQFNSSDWQYCDFTEEDGIFSFFLTLYGEDYVRRPVVSIGLGDDEMHRFNMRSASETIESYGEDFSYVTAYMDYSGDGWDWRYYTAPGTGSPALIPQSDNRYRIIDFTKPVDVTSEFYNAFMLCVDNADITAFDIGYYVGHNIGLGDGYEEGYDHGQVSGYGAGYDDGYEAGYVEGEASVDYPNAEDHAF